MIQLTLILENVRSTANVGSILRTADSVGVEQVICCGITPYPRLLVDNRDPVVIKQNHRLISRSALGAEQSVKVEYYGDAVSAIERCRREGRTIYGLEQAPGALNVLTAEVALPAALVIGSEVDGVSLASLQACDVVLEIPQAGAKESLNVAVATGIAAYRFVK